jgi:tRNA U34 5-methylaminomethyl-2-thiouridine-forming methyltransferase MnmC
MPEFDSASHTQVQSEDGSFTAYSSEYDEHYHSTKDGALHESLYKHVIPAYEHTKHLDEVHILDICFGLGFNTLATLWYFKQQALHAKMEFLQKTKFLQKIYIYSPELDKELIESLVNFSYPQEFSELLPIIEALVENGVFQNEFWHVELFVGDAREYIKTLPHAKMDVVYQDAFSPSANPILWTQEYFADIKKLIKHSGIITTYSTALATRLALHHNGFNIYLNKGENFRNATLASLGELAYEKVDMAHKIACNPDAKPLYD